MAKIYFNLIINGRKTLEDVPRHLQMQVEAMLEEYYKSNT